MVSLTQRRFFARFAFFATLLALVVVLLGAYTRLRDAGLGCPDWPGCYGQLHVPQTTQQLQQASALYPQQPVESAKAWAEMLHRYVAGTLGLLILGLAILAIRFRHQPETPRIVPFILVGLVIFQAILGMWTVTLLLYPPVVMGHLLAGLAILACLWWLTLRSGNYFPVTTHTEIAFKNYRGLALIGLIVLALQITLGGWTSANYAGPACPDFPLCQSQLLPDMNLQKGFNFFVPVGANFQGGLLETTARIAIHLVHRFGALIIFFYVGSLSLWTLLKITDPVLRRIAIIMGAMLLTQVLLGILLVITQLSLWIAVAHNGVAALLLLAMVTLNYTLYFCYECKQS